MKSNLIHVQEFIKDPKAPVLFFAAPYGTEIKTLKWAIRRMQRRLGLGIVAYDFTPAVFRAADPSMLPGLIKEFRDDVTKRVVHYKAQGVTEFGFFGSSLGSFFLYHCLGKVPELTWGVFNNGGNLVGAMWHDPAARRNHIKAGISSEQLKELWRDIQYPKIENLQGNSYLFVGSRYDRVTPLREIGVHFGAVTAAGAKVQIRTLPTPGHIATVVAGLILAPSLLRDVRAR